MPITKTIDFGSDFWINKTILIDSRQVVFPQQSIFFALKGQLTDGHLFIPTLYAQGVRSFVVEQSIDPLLYPEATFIQTNHAIGILQAFAQYHRNQFNIPVIAITGSNGKTILKEWLFLLLEPDFAIIKSPKSYNSQIGVPLSVLGIQSVHDLAIFEAGISQSNEMAALQQIIQPTIGIFTNIGKAHDSGFPSEQIKIQEKLRLFDDCNVLIYCRDHHKIHQAIPATIPTWSWGASSEADLPIYVTTTNHKSNVTIHWHNHIHQIALPFTSAAAIENCLHGIAVLLYLGLPISSIPYRVAKLREVPMRLAIKEGINHSYIIDDSYNNDFEGLKVALDFLQQKHKQHQDYSKTLILSDLSHHTTTDLYADIATLLQQHQIKKFIGIGPLLKKYEQYFEGIPESYFFLSTTDFIQQYQQQIHFFQESILLKGARSFEFERIAQQLKKRVHGTTLEINLGAIRHNFQCYKNLIHPSTKIMVMVKASAYGSGAYEIAQLLQYNHVDYLGVAYVDEGIALRQRGIQVPIMVMNTAIHEFELLCQHELEPIIYNLTVLSAFQNFLEQQQNSTAYPIHVELDTGMHRLGFMPNELPSLIQQLKNTSLVYPKGILSHLAASDAKEHQAFTLQQIGLFTELTQQLEQALEIQCIKHILNSAGLTAYTNYQFDMVRLGIGLYGIDPNKQLLNLRNVAQLKTTIAQLKTLPSTETVGYNRNGKLQSATRIAILSIGYADGFARILGNGNMNVKIHNQWATTIGNICMDMCFVDVSHIPTAQQGDEVIIFDSIESIEALANAQQTIAYEVLTNISERVPRIFYED